MGSSCPSLTLEVMQSQGAMTTSLGWAHELHTLAARL